MADGESGTEKQEPWPSTKALSVYNVLRLRESTVVLIRDILPYLREHFDASYPQAWVDDGVQWLIEKGFVTSNGVFLSAKYMNQRGIPARLVRASGDAELRAG